MTKPEYPRFLFSPDAEAQELYITCTSPLSLIWVKQTIPAQLHIVAGSHDEHVLKDCADWYREKAGQSFNDN